MSTEKRKENMWAHVTMKLSNIFISSSFSNCLQKNIKKKEQRRRLFTSERFIDSDINHHRLRH